MRSTKRYKDHTYFGKFARILFEREACTLCCHIAGAGIRCKARTLRGYLCTSCDVPARIFPSVFSVFFTADRAWISPKAHNYGSHQLMRLQLNGAFAFPCQCSLGFQWAQLSGTVSPVAISAATSSFSVECGFTSRAAGFSNNWLSISGLPSSERSNCCLDHARLGA